MSWGFRIYIRNSSKEGLILGPLLNPYLIELLGNAKVSLIV